MGFLFVKLQRAVISMTTEFYKMVINFFELKVFYISHYQNILGTWKRICYQPLPS